MAESQNSGEQTPNDSVLTIQHQKLFLSIDSENPRIHGSTELKVLIPESGLVKLHADNMSIESVTVDGVIAEFEYRSRYQSIEDEIAYRKVNSTIKAFDAACSSYLRRPSDLPNLVILCSSPVKGGCDEAVKSQILVNTETENSPKVDTYSGIDLEYAEANVPRSSSEANQNVKLIKIDYWIEQSETGSYFEKDGMRFNNHRRPAHCWFPGINVSSQHCPFDLEFTVTRNSLTVSKGTFLYESQSRDRFSQKLLSEVTTCILDPAPGLLSAAELRRYITPVSFRIIDYNILSPGLISPPVRISLGHEMIEWEFRRQALFCEILAYKADVICLQEVEKTDYDEFFASAFEREQYEGVYFGKDQRYRTGGEGLAIFFKKNKFSLIKKYEEYLKKSPDLNASAKNRVNQDHGALYVVLRPLWVDDPSATLCVVNTHIISNTSRKDLKLFQYG